MLAQLPTVSTEDPLPGAVPAAELPSVCARGGQGVVGNNTSWEKPLITRPTACGRLGALTPPCFGGDAAEVCVPQRLPGSQQN